VGSATAKSRPSLETSIQALQGKKGWIAVTWGAIVAAGFIALGNIFPAGGLIGNMLLATVISVTFLSVMTRFASELASVTDAGSASINEGEKARLAELIARFHGMFEGELKDEDQIVYVDNIKGKMLQSQELLTEAEKKTMAQFANSPVLSSEIINAITSALAAHSIMSKQALESERVRADLKDVLLGPARLYEALGEKARQKPGEWP
jgi:hypothetical protein